MIYSVITLLIASLSRATLIAGVGFFLAITLLLVAILLIAKKYLVHSGAVSITINDDRRVEASSGGTLLSTLSEQGIFLSSACGGKGSCGQCRVQVTEGGGEI